MKMILKILFGLLGFISIGFLLYYGAWIFSPGSYSRAEIYQLEASEDSLIQIVNQIKIEYPDLCLRHSVEIPNGQAFQLKDGRKDSTDYWFHIYFYYSDKNQIVNTWIRPKTKTSVDFAFVGLNKGLTLGNWTDVNEHFWWWKNKPIKTEFENRILSKIKEKIQERNSPAKRHL